MTEQARERKPDPTTPEPDAGVDPTVCFCHNVPLSEIRRAIRAGAVTIAEIQARTKASTGCGGCECDVAEILKTEGIR